MPNDARLIVNQRDVYQALLDSYRKSPPRATILTMLMREPRGPVSLADMALALDKLPVGKPGGKRLVIATMPRRRQQMRIGAMLSLMNKDLARIPGNNSRIVPGIPRASYQLCEFAPGHG